MRRLRIMGLFGRGPAGVCLQTPRGHKVELPQQADPLGVGFTPGAVADINGALLGNRMARISRPVGPLWRTGLAPARTWPVRIRRPRSRQRTAYTLFLSPAPPTRPRHAEINPTCRSISSQGFSPIRVGQRCGG